jgi:hypothetical protein
MLGGEEKRLGRIYGKPQPIMRNGDNALQGGDLMGEITKNGQGFVGYEYRDVSVRRDMEQVYADGYPNFGWTLEAIGAPLAGISTVTMKFKRDRKIRNKAELSRLQRQFEAAMSEIATLESSKATGAMALAFTVGIVGSAFLAGSTFAITAPAPNIPLCIILAIPGLTGWVLPYFLYRKTAARKTAQVAPLIDQKYDEICEICEKANGLLN